MGFTQGGTSEAGEEPMTHTVLYVIGPPGVGKSSLVRRLLGWDPFGNPPTFLHLHAKPKWTIAGQSRTDPHDKTRRVAGGHYSGGDFDGGDTVPYTGAIDCLAYWVQNLITAYPLCILDGDRFSTRPSLEFIQAHRPQLTNQVRVMGVHLVASPETLAARRSKRGSNQNAVWVKGRETKARNFAGRLPYCPVLDTTDLNMDDLHLRVSTLLRST